MYKVLLTGAGGFLGKSLKRTIDQDIITLGRHDANIICDLSTDIPKIPQIKLVIHAAGKAHSVPKSNNEIEQFFSVNVRGTQNLLQGLENQNTIPQRFVFISSVAVYGLESGINIKESQTLSAVDPYGLSKVQAEDLVLKWCQKNDVVVTILRLPLVIGKTPPGNLHSMINGLKKGYYFNIARGTARRSMVLANDIGHFLIHVSAVGGIYNLTDGYHPSFYELSFRISEKLNVGHPRNIPLWLAKCISTVGDHLGSNFPLNSNKLSKLTSDLTFDDSKAREVGWTSNMVLEQLDFFDK